MQLVRVVKRISSSYGEGLLLEIWVSVIEGILMSPLSLPLPPSLCRAPSNRVKGSPFRPIKAMAVDLFPQTMHCELLIFFERVEYSNGNSAEPTPDSALVKNTGDDSMQKDTTEQTDEEKLQTLPSA